MINTTESGSPASPTLRPRVSQVVQELTQRINQGRLQPGDQLPTLRELGKAFDVSYGVIHAAFQEMEKHGLIETIHGSGTYVRKRGDTPITRRHRSDVYILMHNTRHAFSAPLDALMGTIQDAGLIPIMLAFDRFQPERVERLIRLWHEAPPKAVIVRGATRQVAETIQKHAPAITRFIIVYNLADGAFPHWHCVHPDEFLAYQTAAQHLISQGHRRIGLPVSTYEGMTEQFVRNLIANKAGGIQQAFTSAGLPDGLLIHPKKVPLGDTSNIGLTDDNIRRTIDWLKGPAAPTAIIENSTRMPYVTVAAREAGLRIGEDLHVVGIGDASPAHRGEYPCVSEQFEEIARQVTAMVVSEEEGFDRVGRQIVVRPVFVPQWKPSLNSGVSPGTALDSNHPENTN